jgi:glycosyltransferase involved in cell wall biosynthesis
MDYNTKKGYLFIANGTKPTLQQAESKEPIFIGSFALSSVEAATELEYSIFLGINRNHPKEIQCVNYPGTVFYDQHCYRNPFAIKDNWTAYKNTCKFLREHPEIEVIHCNTPVGGIVGRLSGRKFKKKVIYTVHGFHFYKGAPLINRTVFKWLEQWLAHYTDAIITINHEDFEAAQRLHYKKGGQAYYVHGVGVNLEVFNDVVVDRKEKLSEFGIPVDASVGIVVGDLNDNKNVGTIIKAIPKVKGNFHVLICGVGPNKDSIEELATRLGFADRVHLLGFRKDVKELLKASDLYLFASKREGLPRSTMEAMASGLPCVVSDIRGNRDLIDEKGGFLIGVKDVEGYAKAINNLLDSSEMRERMGDYNKEKILEFDIKNVRKQMINVFQDILKQ